MRDRRGNTALEYGLINIPFAVLVLGFLELVWQATTAVLLDASALRVARFGVTGQTAPSGAPSTITCRSDAIPWLIVQSSGGLLSSTRLTVTTESLARLSDFAGGTPAAGAGVGGQFVTYSLRYEQPLLTGVWLPITGGELSLTHRATVTVKNEPFTNVVC